MKSGVNINHVTNNTNTALTLAAEKGTRIIPISVQLHFSYSWWLCLLVLLRCEKSLNELKLMWFYSRLGHIDIVKLLIEGGADVNAAKSDGITAIILAAREGMLPILWNYSRMTKFTIQFYFWSGHLNITESLIRNGANVNAWESNNDTALILSAKNGRLQEFNM